MIAYLLTTIDNRYDPFDEFEKWYAEDFRLGHNCSGYLADIAAVGNEMSFKDRTERINDAVNEIVKLNLNGMYIRIAKDVGDPDEEDIDDDDPEEDTGIGGSTKK